MTESFELQCPFEPMGDQPEAIRQLSEGLRAGDPHQTLLGITGSGKTFTMAAVIAEQNRPTLILSPNKTLAAQLFGEFRELFPNNAVEYFVSYYDYYQPEAYVASTDTFIEKDASRNENIERLRNSATRSLLERRDVVIIASVSCIYGLGSPSAYEEMSLKLSTGTSIERDDLLRRLTQMQYSRNNLDFRRGTFRARGDVVEVFPAYEEDRVIRFELFGNELESILEVDPLRGEVLAERSEISVYPSGHYVTPKERIERAIEGIEDELEQRMAEFKRDGRLLQLQRIEQRTRYDLELLRATGMCNGIENYSRWMDGRSPGQAPFTLLNYFPEDFVVFVDESHVAVPQVGAMYKGDRSRKSTLVEHGFRLPSALDNRPLQFPEWEKLVKQAVYVSATPGEYELKHSQGRLAEQIVRPTGLLDPAIEIRPARTQIDDLLHEVKRTTQAGWRTLVTTLTKRSAEELTTYLSELGVRVRYLHSEIDAIERTQILRDLRLGEFDVLIGINLLREGLDLPEVALVAVLDADKEGFLRSATSLIQTCGRAARNVEGRVIFYAEKSTRSIEATMSEVARRRARQTIYNAERGITPQTIIKPVRDSLEALYDMDFTGPELQVAEDGKSWKDDPAHSWSKGKLRGEIAKLNDDMLRAAEELRFEEAASLRDRVKTLQELEALPVSDYPWPETNLSAVAERPGVYLFKNARGKVLYVGKARDLKSRLATYRTPGGDGRLGVRFLERDARTVETIVTRTESEALLLEDTLIKQYKPPHNVRLKDDKSFLMIRIDDEPFPRLQFVRAHDPRSGRKKGRSRYFGPFASARSVRRTMSDLHRVVPLRDCSDSVMNHRSRPCLKHQIGLCSAPCVDLIGRAEYGELVERAARILSGDVGELERDLDERMRVASEKLDYELAAEWRDRLAALRRTVEGQGVQAGARVERDVLGLARAGEDALVHRLAFREGRLAESRSHLFRSELPDEELLHVVLTALYGQGRRTVPREVLVPCAPNDAELLETTLGSGTRLVVPRGGDRQRMLDLAGENARAELRRRMEARGSDERAARELAKLVDLPEPGGQLVVDCFDVSNFQASNVVASRVRFRAGMADRAGYRRFRIRSVEGQDDFAAMYEVVERSLRRGVSEGDLPDLIVIDGGPAQLAKALEARDDAGAWDVRVVSLAKARSERKVKGKRKGPSEERVFLRPDTEAIELPRHSDVRLLLERIRNEAHRFAITYHRKERGRITSKLDSIAGVGPAKRKALLRRFGSVVGVARASVEELRAVPGISPKLATVILESLRK